MPFSPGSSIRYLGSVAVTTDESGNATFDVVLDAETSAGELVSATATDVNGNTSEFSDLNLIPVAPVAGLFTSEGGAQATLSVVLAIEPTADVTVALSSSDTTEGTVSPAALIFTPENWDHPQTATITGVDDTIADGPISYTIITEPAASADSRFAGFNPDDVQVLNYDNDFAQQTAIQPPGSLIYDSVLEGVIGTPGHTESYSLRLDPGQTLTVLVEPSGGLRATIKVLAPNRTLLGSATAPAAGADALLQTVHVPGQIADDGSGPKTYTVRVGGANGTIGNYRLKVVLNAALESESAGGTSDDTPATAQDVNGSWVLFQSAGSSGQQPGAGGCARGRQRERPSGYVQSEIVGGPDGHGRLDRSQWRHRTGGPARHCWQHAGIGASDLANNVSQLINNYVVNKTGTYYLQVTGTAQYSLVVTRNTTFDSEGNDSIATAKDLSTPEVASSRWALGALAVQSSYVREPRAAVHSRAQPASPLGRTAISMSPAQQTNSVLRYDGMTGAFLDTFVSSNSGGLSGPIYLVFGPDSNLYVTSIITSSVLRYDGYDRSFLGTFASGQRVGSDPRD